MGLYIIDSLYLHTMVLYSHNTLMLLKLEDQAGLAISVHLYLSNVLAILATINQITYM